MSATCPKCGTINDQDFGLVNCTGCGAVLAVDVDGNVQVAEANQDNSGALNLDPAGAITEAPAEAEFIDIQDSMATAAEVSEIEAEPEVQVLMDDELTRPFQELAGELSADQSSSLNEPSAQPQNSREAMDEITQFGNKDSSAGPISYTIVLEGVDLAPIHTKLKEVISQRQFGWDAPAIMRQIKNGKLVLGGLSPAQTVMLLRLLRGTNIQISWSQHVYS